MQPFADRFDAKVHPEPTTGCHLWVGATNSKGYGSIRSGGRGAAIVDAHRVAWEREHGPIPGGLFVLHRCDTPACVNVEHLRLGTQLDNMRDMASKGRARGGGFHSRAKTHCVNGHAFDDQNTRVTPNGTRYCRACARQRAHDRRHC
jgi:hypothetical protein